MVMVAQRRGSDDRITVASSCNDYTSLMPSVTSAQPCMISKPPHTPLQHSIARPVPKCASTTPPAARAHLQLSWMYHHVVHLRFPIPMITFAHLRGQASALSEGASAPLRHVSAADFVLHPSLKHA